MKIGIIDADLLAETTHFPNLVCMKISSYFKKNGNDVELILSYDDLFTPAYVGEWRGIARVWFTIEPYKVTEQWHKEV